MIFWGRKNIAGECSLKIPYSTIADNAIVPISKKILHAFVTAITISSYTWFLAIVLQPRTWYK